MWSAVSKRVSLMTLTVVVSIVAVPCVWAETPGQSLGGTIPAVAAPGVVEAPGAEDGLREDALVMGRAANAEREALQNLARDFEVKTAQINVLKAEKELAELRTSVGIKNEQGDLPQLVGVFKMPKRAWAEFLVGTVVLSASEGEWVTSEWRLQSLLTNGVTLASKGGERRTLLFGNRSTTADAPVDYPRFIDPAQGR